VVFDKTVEMIRTEPELNLADFSGISAPPWYCKGTGMKVTLAHSAEVAGAVPDGRLAVLPGTHALPLENAEVVNTLLVSFLRNGAPASFWGLIPARRRAAQAG
jgi:hypothetical protein